MSPSTHRVNDSQGIKNCPSGVRRHQQHTSCCLQTQRADQEQHLSHHRRAGWAGQAGGIAGA